MDTCARLTILFLCDTCTVGPEIHTWRYTHWPRQAACTSIIVLSVVIKKNTASNQQSTFVQWCLNFSLLNVA